MKLNWAYKFFSVNYFAHFLVKFKKIFKKNYVDD